MRNRSADDELTLRPIGYVRAASRLKFDSPRQPDQESHETNEIELLPGLQFELAVQDLKGFDRIWLVSWFHQNHNWRPRVLPPRGPAQRRGVFATRSPHRPNPIGLSCVRLISAEGRILRVGALDLVDGTPILDIKPYVTKVDSFPESRSGWIDNVDRAESAPAHFQVVLEPLAKEQLTWLSTEWNIDFTARSFEILRRDPTPHRTRRILQLGPTRFRISCGPWRVFYRIEEDVVTVEEIGSGLTEDALNSPQRPDDREAHVAFKLFQWPGIRERG